MFPCRRLRLQQVSTTLTSMPGVSLFQLAEALLCSGHTASIVLHLLHPFALQNLQEAVGHVRRFRNELDPLPPKSENSSIAKETLMDIVNSAGVNVDAFLSLLDNIKPMLKVGGMCPVGTLR
jgi:hypothetical protein